MKRKKELITLIFYRQEILISVSKVENYIFRFIKCPNFNKWYSGRVLSNEQNGKTQWKDVPTSHIQVEPELTHIFLCKKWRREWGYWEKIPKQNQTNSKPNQPTKPMKQKSPQKL